MPQSYFNSGLDVVFHELLPFWAYHVDPRWTTTWFFLRNITIQYLIVDQFVFKVIDLTADGTFKLFRLQIHFLAFLDKGLPWWARRLIWLIVCHNWPMHQFSGIFGRGHKVRARTGWAVVRHDWSNTIWRMTVLSWILLKRPVWDNLHYIFYFSRCLTTSATKKKYNRRSKGRFEDYSILCSRKAVLVRCMCSFAGASSLFFVVFVLCSHSSPFCPSLPICSPLN